MTPEQVYAPGAMKIDGYGIDVTLEENVLTVHARNKAAHTALVGPKRVGEFANRAKKYGEDIGEAFFGEERSGTAATSYVEGDVVIPVQQIRGVEVKPATRLVNGKLTITTADGFSYQLHYRRKQADGFDRLAAALADRS